MADVFISYAKEERALTEALVAHVVDHGYSVWWDTQMLGGRRFEQEITAQIDACVDAIIIWTPISIVSDWVQSEAEHARRAGKLINTFGNGLEPHRIPKPFDRFHALPVSDYAGILRSLNLPPPFEAALADAAFYEESVRLFREHATRLHEIAIEEIDEESTYTPRLVTAAAMLEEPVDAFLDRLPLSQLGFDDRVHVTKLEPVIREVKRQLSKEQAWLTKRFSSSVLIGARGDLGWAGNALLEALQ